MTTQEIIPLVLLFLAAVSAPTDIAENPAPAALDFSYADLAGAPHKLSDLRGHLVLLEFWASWCVPCREGFPFLEGLRAAHETAGLKVLAVTLETEDAAVNDFVTAHPGRFLIGRDPSGRAAETFEVAAMPTSVLIDPQGKVLARFEGGTDTVHRQIETAVEAALRQDPLAAAQAGTTPRRRTSEGSLRAWERGYLADPIMNLDGDPLTRSFREHIHASKEAAAGDGGVAGGGCGCN